MPWRDTPTPYYVWISEIMLQQTQVATVIPYFERFIQRFPNIESLANAKLAEVIKAWQGLGYYSRSRHLYATARHLMRKNNGRLPDSNDALLALPGIGPYTAAAILSIAFGQAIPAVDGNVLRVGSRFWGLRVPVQSPKLKTLIFKRLQAVIPERHASEFNQAMMELGALICKPHTPDCPQCPIQGSCEAFRTDRTRELPVKKKRASLPHYAVAVGVVWKNGKILLAQRRQDQMLGGLWEFPGGKQRPGESLRQTARREILEETALRVKIGRPYGTIQHAYSHFRITLTAFLCLRVAGKARARPGQRLAWVALNQMDRYPVPKATGKVIELIRGTSHFSTSDDFSRGDSRR